MHRTLLLTTLLTILALACGGGDDDAPSEYPPPQPLDLEYTACTDVAQCEVVELGCCDACNGGTAVSVHIEKAAEVIERYSERCATPTSCTQRGCPPFTSACDNGVCTLVQGSF